MKQKNERQATPTETDGNGNGNGDGGGEERGSNGGTQIFLIQFLIEEGFFPTAPSQPQLAFSFDALQLFRQLSLFSGSAVTAYSAALREYYNEKGLYYLNSKVRFE